ncbi:MAG: hypothetical protein L6R39_004886 [Caloplaca ligustica]|nr:MAG: hypothetical protein L6R39_004886 [Caloplaca ligustica]
MFGMKRNKRRTGMRLSPSSDLPVGVFYSVIHESRPVDHSKESFGRPIPWSSSTPKEEGDEWEIKKSVRVAPNAQEFSLKVAIAPSEGIDCLLRFILDAAGATQNSILHTSSGESFAASNRLA